MSQDKSGQSKRPASSPLADETVEKRPCAGNESFVDSDCDNTEEEDNTVIYSHPHRLSGTLLDSSRRQDDISPPEMFSQQHVMSIKDEVKAAMVDPVVLELLSKAVAAQVTNQLRKEMVALREQLAAKDQEIKALQDQVDNLGQYGRRNNVRISPIPETAGENTDTIVQTVAKAVGVDIPDHAIDRSHRVGRQGSDRAVLVKITSYKYKQAFLKARGGLKKVDGKKLFPALLWPAPPRPGSQASSSSSAPPKIFVNDDLTKLRADVARRARMLKRDGKITDTWTRDGIIFVKKGTDIHKITRVCEIDALG